MDKLNENFINMSNEEMKSGKATQLPGSGNEEEMVRLRVRKEAEKAIKEVQGKMRTALGGYRPDRWLVASEMLILAGRIPSVEKLVARNISRLFADFEAEVNEEGVGNPDGSGPAPAQKG